MDKLNVGKHIVKGSVLYRVLDNRDLLIVPRNMQTKVIHDVHNIGHFGLTKTELLIWRDYSITGLKTNIKSVIRNCVLCIQINGKQDKQEGYFH